MARTARTTYTGNLTVTETVDPADSPASGTNGASRVYDAYNLTDVLSSSGTPEISGDTVDATVTFAAADQDVDLTLAPLAGKLSDTVNMTGKKLVQIILFAAVANNAAGIVIKPHATNGYALFGTSGQITLYPGEHLVKTLKSGGTVRTPAVGPTSKVLRRSGTIGDVLNMLLVFA